MTNPGIRTFALSLVLGSGLAAQAPSVTATTKPMFGSAIRVLDPLYRMDATVDVNLDGHMDAIGFWTMAANADAGELHAFLNDGTGRMSALSLQKDIAITKNNPTPDVFLGDWNGDGNLDFGLDQRTNKFSFFVSTKTGPSAVKEITLAISGTVSSIVAADYNEDGKDDLAVLTSTHFYIFLNSSGYPQTLGFARTGGGSDMRTIDIGKDGKQDLVHLFGSNEIQFVKVNHKSGWTTSRTDAVTNHASFKTGVTQKLMPACGDVDGDKDDDLVLFVSTGAYIQFSQGTGNVFKAGPWITGGPATALADVDGDGDLDGICCGGGGGNSGKANYVRVKFEVAINDNGKFRPSVRFDNIGARHIAGAADMDGDKKVDLVAGRGILFNRDQFDIPVTKFIVGASRSKVGIRGTADIDGDGDLDIDNDWSLRDHYGNPGDGQMQMVPTGIPAAPTGLNWATHMHYRGDWDGDGDLDFLASVSYPVHTRLLLNQGGSSYTDAGAITPAADSLHPQYPTTARQADYFAGDLNGDGLDDLITWDIHGRNRTFLNGGGGKFTESTQKLNQRIREVRDLNGDGYPDVLALGSLGKILIFWNAKNGAFSSPQTLHTLTNYNGFEVVDIDADGDLDIVVAQRIGTSGTSLQLLLNSSGTFTTHTLLSGRSSSAEVRVLDLDGDGRKDIWVSPGSAWDADTVVTLRQTATGGFEWSEQINNEKTYVLADMDGDGDADIVGDGTIQLNVTHHPKNGGIYQQFGVATKGTRGIEAVMGATGPFRPGHFSSLTLRHVPKAFAVVVAGVTETNLVNFPWVGTNTYVAPQPVVVVVQLDAKGAWSTGVTLPAGVAESTILFQAYVLDNTAPVGFISTNGVRIRYGK